MNDTDPELKQILRVIASALVSLAELQSGKDNAASQALTWMGNECHLLATYRKDTP